MSKSSSFNSSDFDDTDERPSLMQKYTMDEKRIQSLVTKISSSKRITYPYINTYADKQPSDWDLLDDYKPGFGKSEIDIKCLHVKSEGELKH